jgi:hypothetical protein
VIEKFLDVFKNAENWSAEITVTEACRYRLMLLVLKVLQNGQS